MTSPKHVLSVFDERIEARVREIAKAHQSRLCRRGCAACCKSLGEIPHASLAEWERLREGLLRLDAAVRSAVEARIDALVANPNTRPVVCPLLDRDEDVCLVYDHRLLLCRTYGYYVSRGFGRWCEAIESDLAGRKTSVMFGNLDALMEDVRRVCGDSILLTEWWTKPTLNFYPT